MLQKCLTIAFALVPLFIFGMTLVAILFFIKYIHRIPNILIFIIPILVTVGVIYFAVPEFVLAIKDIPNIFSKTYVSTIGEVKNVNIVQGKSPSESFIVNGINFEIDYNEIKIWFYEDTGDKVSYVSKSDGVKAFFTINHKYKIIYLPNCKYVISITKADSK